MIKRIGINKEEMIPMKWMMDLQPLFHHPGGEADLLRNHVVDQEEVAYQEAAHLEEVQVLFQEEFHHILEV